MLIYETNGFTFNWQNVFCTKSLNNDIWSYGIHQNKIPTEFLLKEMIEASLTLKRMVICIQKLIADVISIQT